MSTRDMYRLVIGRYTDPQRGIHAAGLLIAVLIGGYAIVDGAQAMREFYDLTVSLGAGAVGLDTWFEFFTSNAPLLTFLPNLLILSVNADSSDEPSEHRLTCTQFIENPSKSSVDSRER